MFRLFWDFYGQEKVERGRRGHMTRQECHVAFRLVACSISGEVQEAHGTLIFFIIIIFFREAIIKIKVSRHR